MGEAVVGRSASVRKHINVIKRTHNVICLGRLGSINVEYCGNVGTGNEKFFHLLLVDYSTARGVYEYRILGKKLKMLLSYKPPLCKGRWRGVCRDGGVVFKSSFFTL